MPEPRRLEHKSAERIAFDHWMRTGHRLPPPVAIELKFNHNHDERGRFTFGAGGAAATAGGGGRTAGIGAMRGYPEEGSDSWRRANDAVFARAAAEWNASQRLSPGDPRYATPRFMKAWAMIESGGDKHAFLTDPFQVNNRGDWVKEKADYGLAKGQAMTPNLSARAALGWLDAKAHTTHDGVTRYIGIERALRRYNSYDKPDANGIPHKIGYARRVLSLSGK